MEPGDLRDDIPALDGTIYLNTGASGPSPTRVVDAVERFYEHHEYTAPGEEGMYTAAFDVFDDTRAVLADFLNTTPQDVALTQSTTDGINRVACATDWEAGDVVVRTDLEHSSGILPWKRVRDRRGIDIEVVETEEGRLDVDAYKEAVDGARLVCLSALTWTHGTMLPVAELVDIAHDAGARVLVDAVQVPGQRPLDVTEWGADYVAAAGHKWLLGPWGGGFLHVHPEAADALEPAQIGYRSVEDPNAAEYQYKPGAQRLEVGTVSPAPYVGLQEAIATIEDIGLSSIQSRIETLTDRLKDGIGSERLLSPRAYESGLVSFAVEDPETFVSSVASDGIQIRSLPIPGVVRASVHVFNTEPDVDALLEHC